MRQAGYLAAACLYALENNIERLAADHKNARQIADTLQQLSWIKNVLPAETNILIFELNPELTSVESVLTYLKENDILVVQFGKHQIRMVTHMDITKESVETVCKVLTGFIPGG